MVKAKASPIIKFDFNFIVVAILGILDAPKEATQSVSNPPFKAMYFKSA